MIFFIALGISLLLSAARDPLHLDALSLSQRLEDGRLTALELMQATLSRIDELNPQLNAVILLSDRDVLLQKASKADRSERKGWLHGIPTAIKDLSNVRGFPTTMGGSPLCNDDAQQESDPWVQRLLDAGAIVIGKTNTPEAGLGSHTYNRRWGTTLNPYNSSLSAGGSSGGAAVAIASHMLAIADGSDMMGSLRNPAGWNHLYSLRPTAGLLEYEADSPRNPLDYPISTVGPMARSVRDLRAFLGTMVGPDEFSKLRHDDSSIGEDPKLWRIAWLGNWNGAFPMEAGVLETCRRALADLEKVSAVEVVDVADCIFPAEDLWRSWTTIRSAWISYTELQKHSEEVLLGNSSLVRDELQWEVKRGLAISSEELHAAGNTANHWTEAAELLFQEYDAFALPSAQVWPFPSEWSRPARIGDVEMDTYHRWMEVVVPASLGGLPAVTVPGGFSKDGMPMGIQLVGRRYEDHKLLQLAQPFK